MPPGGVPTPRLGLVGQSLVLILGLERLEHMGNDVCRYDWHSAGSLGWPFPMEKYKYTTYFSNKIFGSCFIKSSTRKLLWFEISILHLKNKFIVSFTIIFATLSFHIPRSAGLPPPAARYDMATVTYRPWPTHESFSRICVISLLYYCFRTERTHSDAVDRTS